MWQRREPRVPRLDSLMYFENMSFDHQGRSARDSRPMGEEELLQAVSGPDTLASTMVRVFCRFKWRR